MVLYGAQCKWLVLFIYWCHPIYILTCYGFSLISLNFFVSMWVCLFVCLFLINRNPMGNTSLFPFWDTEKHLVTSTVKTLCWWERSMIFLRCIFGCWQQRLFWENGMPPTVSSGWPVVSIHRRHWHRCGITPFGDQYVRSFPTPHSKSPSVRIVGIAFPWKSHSSRRERDEGSSFCVEGILVASRVVLHRSPSCCTLVGIPAGTFWHCCPVGAWTSAAVKQKAPWGCVVCLWLHVLLEGCLYPLWWK